MTQDDSHHRAKDHIIWEWKSFDQLSTLDLHACMALRQEVFVIEQRCFYLDADEKDLQSHHLMAWLVTESPHISNKTTRHHQLIAYLRVYPQAPTWKIGRVLVRNTHRSKGLGAALMVRCHQHLSERGAVGTSLAAQVHVIPFYERLGYKVSGEPFIDAGIPHQDMSLDLLDPKMLQNLSRPRVIIFDFDGTLVDSAFDYAICFQTLARKWNESLPVPHTDQITSLMFAGIRPQIEYALGPLDKAQFLRALELFRDICLRTPLTHTALYPGVHSVLKHLTSLGYRLVICTNRPQDLCEAALEPLNIAHFFELVVGGDRGLERKPSPDMLTAIFRSLQVSAEECLFIGDSEVDIMAGTQAHCQVAAAYWGYTPPATLDELTSPFIKLRHIHELQQYLD